MMTKENKAQLALGTKFQCEICTNVLEHKQRSSFPIHDIICVTCANLMKKTMFRCADCNRVLVNHDMYKGYSLCVDCGGKV